MGDGGFSGCYRPKRAALLLQMLCGFFGVEYVSRVEKRADEYEYCVQNQINWPSRYQMLDDEVLVGDEAGNCNRDAEHPRSEEGRNNSCRIELDLQSRRQSFKHAIADLTFGIVDWKLPPRALEHDCGAGGEDKKPDRADKVLLDSSPRSLRSAMVTIGSRSAIVVSDKSMSAMPLPRPNAVICSLSQARNTVPAVRVATVESRYRAPGSMTEPLICSSPAATP